MAWRPATRGAIAIAILWALGVGLAAWLGDQHGYVPEAIRASLPYEWRAVVFVGAAITVEACALFWVLFRFKAGSAMTRTAAALGLFSAALVLHVATSPTDLPAACYVNVWWAALVWLMLVVVLVKQAAVRLFAGWRARRA